MASNGIQRDRKESAGEVFVGAAFGMLSQLRDPDFSYESLRKRQLEAIDKREGGLVMAYTFTEEQKARIRTVIQEAQAGDS